MAFNLTVVDDDKSLYAELEGDIGGEKASMLQIAVLGVMAERIGIDRALVNCLLGTTALADITKEERQKIYDFVDWIRTLKFNEKLLYKDSESEDNLSS